MPSRSNFVAVENRAEGQYLRDTEKKMVMFLTLGDGTLETNAVNQGRT